MTFWFLAPFPYFLFPVMTKTTTVMTTETMAATDGWLTLCWALYLLELITSSGQPNESERSLSPLSSCREAEQLAQAHMAGNKENPGSLDASSL